jgi:hypothetical protein
VKRALRWLAALAALAFGIGLALWGAFALLYRDEGDGNTFVTLAGRRTDAHLAGGIALAIGLAAIFVGGWLLKRRDRRFANPS